MYINTLLINIDISYKLSHYIIKHYFFSNFIYLFKSSIFGYLLREIEFYLGYTITLIVSGKQPTNLHELGFLIF